MKIEWLGKNTAKGAAVVLPVFQGDAFLGEEGKKVDAQLQGRLSAWLQQEVCCHDKGDTFLLRSCQDNLPDLLLLQFGKREKLNVQGVRFCLGQTVRVLEKAKISQSVFLLDELGLALEESAYEAALGAILGGYRFDCYKSKKKEPVLQTLFLQTRHTVTPPLEQALQSAIVTAEAVLQARNWVNQPAAVMTPEKMAEEAQRLATLHGMDVDVWDAKRMRAAGMGALSAVAQGSDVPPRLIVLRYCGGIKGKPWDAAFVGKGITFDSGGISLKPGEGMQEMKDDMSGAAAVLAAMDAIAALKLPVNLLAVLPCTENMPSGKALKPGDIVTAMDGQTIEVINTDAEGRLILADAVAYARHEGAQRIIDVATLTGACMVALGRVRSGLLGNDAAWTDLIVAAGERAGEKTWLMPHDEEYAELLKSDIADLKNTGGRYGGMITGGLFIGAFAKETPWAHLDIAGTATLLKTSGAWVKGGSGAGVLTLLEIAKSLVRL